MIKPLKEYVVIEPIEEKDKSEGGVYLPESSKDKPMKGKIVAISKDSPVKVGDIVIYKKWISNEFEGMIIAKFDELLAVIDNA